LGAGGLGNGSSGLLSFILRRGGIQEVGAGRWSLLTVGIAAYKTNQEYDREPQ
jgi:hypothetical protein